MDPFILYPSATLGLLVVIIYWVRCWYWDKELDLSVIVNIVFQASGVVCGFLLIAGTFSEQARLHIQQIDLYIFVSGLVVLVTCCRGLYEEVFKKTRKSIGKKQSHK